MRGKIMRVNEIVKTRINDICTEFGLTLYALSCAANIPESTLRRYMEGYRDDIKLKTIFRICKVVGITPNEFFETESFKNLDKMEDL